MIALALQPLSHAAQLAHQALRDCSVIRCRFDHAGYEELRRRGIAYCTQPRADQAVWDYRLMPVTPRRVA